MAAQPTPQAVEKRSVWSEPSFLVELVSMTALALWLIFAAVNSKLDPNIMIAVGVILYLTFVLTLLFRQRQLDSIHLKELQMQESSRSRSQFMTEVQGASSRARADLEARFAALEAVVLMLEESLNGTALTTEKKIAYQELVTRIRDMQRSLYGDAFELRFRSQPRP